MKRRLEGWGGRLAYGGLTVLLILAATGIGVWFHEMSFPETNIVIIYIFAVLLVSRFTVGYGYGVVSAVLATLAFNYFFTVPRFTLSVNDPSYLLTFAVMTAAAVTMGAITARAAQSEQEAHREEKKTRILYALTNRLTEAEDMEDIKETARQAVGSVLNCDVEFAVWGEGGPREPDVPEECKWPVRGKEGTLGMIVLPRRQAQQLGENQAGLLHAMTECIALAMDRMKASVEKAKSQEEMTQERCRANMLRAISHDLRTPLTQIMGTSEMLMDMTEPEDPRRPLEEGIYKDANWLHSLVENILNLTRLQDGRLTIRKQPEVAEEIMGSALNHIAKIYPEHEITVKIPEEPLFVPMDAKLITQVLINLLDNAVKHTPAGEMIELSAETDESGKNAVFRVADHGSGIAEADLPKIFEAFYTKDCRYADAVQGIGLGLVICRTAVTAHGGEITAENNPDGRGAVFTFTLPLERGETP